MKFSALVVLLLFPLRLFAADPRATVMECFALSWNQHCQSKDHCDPPPPLPHQQIGSVPLKITEGSGWLSAVGTISKVFPLNGQDLRLVATGVYTVNKDGSVYSPGIGLEFAEDSSGLSISTNGAIQGTSASLNASVNSKPASDGSYSHAFADIFCQLR